MLTAAATMTATETTAVAATRKTAAAAAMATATAIATTAMMMATATVMAVDVQLLVRARAFKDVGLWGFDDLSPLAWFLRYAHCVLCPPLECFSNYGQTPPAVGRKRFAPAPGKPTLLTPMVRRV